LPGFSLSLKPLHIPRTNNVAYCSKRLVQYILHNIELCKLEHIAPILVLHYLKVTLGPYLFDLVELRPQVEFLGGCDANIDDLLLILSHIEGNEFAQVKLLFLHRVLRRNAKDSLDILPMLHFHVLVSQSLHNRHGFSEVENLLLEFCHSCRSNWEISLALKGCLSVLFCLLADLGYINKLEGSCSPLIHEDSAPFVK